MTKFKSFSKLQHIFFVVYIQPESVLKNLTLVLQNVFLQTKSLSA